MTGTCIDPKCSYFHKHKKPYNGPVRPYGPFRICDFCFGRRMKQHADGLEHRPTFGEVSALLQRQRQEYIEPMRREIAELQETKRVLEARLAILEERLGPTVVQRKSLSAMMRDFRTDNPDATVRQIADRFGVAPDTVKKALKGCRPQERPLLKTN
jgi:hypothetical protein